jgi:hypothetical protein
MESLRMSMGNFSRLQIAQIASIVLGIALFLLGANIDSGWMINLGLLLTGAGTLSSGIDTLVTNRVSFWGYLIEGLQGSGLRAVLAGLMLTLVGIWSWTIASIRIFGLEQQAGAYLSSHPAMILLNAALFLFLLGIFTFLRLEGWSATVPNMLGALPILLTGLFFLLAAVIALAVGLYALFEPTIFSS